MARGPAHECAAAGHHPQPEVGPSAFSHLAREDDPLPVWGVGRARKPAAVAAQEPRLAVVQADVEDLEAQGAAGRAALALADEEDAPPVRGELEPLGAAGGEGADIAAAEVAQADT